MRKVLLWLPLMVFALFAGVLLRGLVSPESATIGSKMVGKPVPQFSLPPVVPSHPGLSSADLKSGKPVLLNIFASWCLPCAAEAPVLLELQKQGVEIHAIAIRDKPDDVVEFLRKHGDPYARIGSDVSSKVQISLGSSGVPESFVIDGKGVVRMQHIGDIRAEDVPQIVAALKAAQ
ncbi:MAG: DsbE family thiol:disulfide interchange protein [Alphaproteobacteria bacterium]|nr:DsbE family thiol:disulfide interchange protein [Alphaproteobacteria bacterium]